MLNLKPVMLYWIETHISLLRTMIVSKWIQNGPINKGLVSNDLSQPESFLGVIGNIVISLCVPMSFPFDPNI